MNDRAARLWVFSKSQRYPLMSLASQAVQAGSSNRPESQLVCLRSEPCCVLPWMSFWRMHCVRIFRLDIFEVVLNDHLQCTGASISGHQVIRLIVDAHEEWIRTYDRALWDSWCDFTQCWLASVTVIPWLLLVRNSFPSMSRTSQPILHSRPCLTLFNEI